MEHFKSETGKKLETINTAFESRRAELAMVLVLCLSNRLSTRKRQIPRKFGKTGDYFLKIGALNSHKIMTQTTTAAMTQRVFIA